MTNPVVLLATIGAALVALVAGGLELLGWREIGLLGDTRVAAFEGVLCLSGALWLLAVAIVRRGPLPPRTLWLVLLVAAAMRILTLIAPPALSSDVYRYVWDGRVQLAGINPYRYVPAADELAALRDEAVYPHINRAEEAHTIYPPAAQEIFALAAVIAPGVFGMKAMMLAFDVLAIGALLVLLRMAGRDPAQLLIYAWLPLPVWEFGGNAHIDAAAAGLLALALVLAARKRSVLVGGLLATAALTKFLPVVVLPAFWRRWNWQLAIGFMVTAGVLYVPYVAIGWRVFGFLDGYVSEEGFANGHGVFPLQLLAHLVALPGWVPKAYLVLVVATLAALAVSFEFVVPLPRSASSRIAVQARQAVILGAVTLAAVSPHYPWYFGWLAPFACLAPLPCVLWMLAAAPLLAHGALEYLAVPGAVYGPAAILALVDLYRSRASRLPIPPQAVRSA